ncbi:MAG: copper-translocating P-type ATPase [Desulfobacterales bacterium]|nr:MAG: copper-translocating P-type ATPase [Desulfobacterales bacterium]
MIGRFAKPGVYRELLTSRDFYQTFGAGCLAGLSYYIGGDAVDRHPDAIFLAIASVCINGLPIIWGAIRGLMEHEVNVDELVSLAIIASMLQGEFLAAAVVSFVMTLGSLIEEATAESARNSIKALAKLSPRTATVVDGEEQRDVPVAEVAVGDHILIKPGDQVPVDAVILTGVSSIDESAMTGESMPRNKKTGDAVYAGTLNHNGVLTAEVRKVGEDTTLGRVIQLVAEAEQHRPEAIRLIDRYARWFTPLILAAAGITFAISGSVDRAVAVLIVGCPCALILAAPTATVAALGRAAKAGVLVKGGIYLERVAGVQAVLFDKTGTLTCGTPRVEEIRCMPGVEEAELLACAAGAEQNCTHPLARAILKAAHYARVAVRGAENAFHEIGLGVRAMVDGSLVEVGSVYAGREAAALPAALQGQLTDAMSRGATPLVVYRDREPVGLLNVSDKIRRDSAFTVDEFKKLGIRRLGILSGDHRQAVDRVAASVGIRDAWPRLKPEDKVNIIAGYREEDVPAMFVGDGINDAPALAGAHVGVVMGAAGTDVALESAHVALVHDDISRLPWLIRLSRRMLTIIKINLAFGLAFNAAAVIAGGMGLLSPIMAAIVHNFGSVLVVLVAASLTFYPDGGRAPEAVS